METVARRLSRREFFKGTGAGALAMAGAAAGLAPPAPARAAPTSFTNVVDMTHTFTPSFPTFSNMSGIELETMTSYDSDGYNMHRWHVIEHAGTHLDAPIHFSESGQTAEAIPPEHFVLPLAVIDIKARAAENPDAQVTPDDIKAWESRHGPIPQGAAVAMNSGWDRHADGDMFRNADDAGTMHFPGFHVEAATYLMEETGALGMAVDTLSLDHGPSAKFETHYAWLPTNRWGLEAIRNLDAVPAAGATLIVGAPKIAGATGGLTRVMALV
jgi:kynurenine formamidase